MFRDLLLKNEKKNDNAPRKTASTKIEVEKKPNIVEKKEEKNITPETKNAMPLAPLDHLTAINHKAPTQNTVKLATAYNNDKTKNFIQLRPNVRNRRKAKVIYYPIEFDSTMKDSQIALPRHMREYLGYEDNKEIPPVEIIRTDKSAAKKTILYVDVQLRQVKKVKAEAIDTEIIEPEDFSNYLKKYLSDYPLTVGQVLLVPHPTREHIFYELVINDINFENDLQDTNDIPPNIYTLTEDSKINLSLSFMVEAEGKIRLSNARRLNLDFVKRGIGGHKEELSQLVRTAFYTRAFDTEIVKAYGIQHSKGILLYGPPGTGKTLIARQISNVFSEDDQKHEASQKKPKVSVINGPELKNKMVGQSAENLRNIFIPAIKEWKEKGDASDVHIIIIDEIDALAPPRGSRTGGTGVDDDMVATLLTMIDGVDSPGNILIIGTTNRMELIDPALLRPGRISVHIKIGLPDQEGRLEILNIHTRSQRETNMLDESVKLVDWAEKTENYTGAEIKDLVDRSTQYAMSGNFNPEADVLEVKKDLKRRDQYAKITHEHFKRAFSEITPAFGINKKNFSFKEDKFIIYSDEMSSIKSKYEESLAALNDNNGLNGFRFLISGENGTGKTELAKYLASISDAKFIKIISADELLRLPINQRLDKLDQEFLDAQHSDKSVIILDGLENLLEADFDLSRPVNPLRIKFQSLLKNIENSENKCIVIATTRSEEFANKMFPGLFNDSNQLANVVIKYSNTYDIARLAQIAKTFNISVIQPVSTENDHRLLNLPINQLIFEMKRFCFGREKTNKLDTDNFYKFLHEKSNLHLPTMKRDISLATSRSGSLFEAKETKQYVSHLNVVGIKSNP